MRILLLGCGNMGAAIVAGYARRVPDATIMAVDPDVEQARLRLATVSDSDVVVHVAETAGWQPDIVLIAVKPQQFAAKLCLPEWRDALVVSVMAGVTLETVARHSGATRTVRVMPNLPAVIGHGMTVGHAGAAVSADDRARTAEIFEAVGAFLWVEKESEIDSCTAVSGSGPGYVFSFAEHFEHAAKAAGVPDAIVRPLVAQTLAGAAVMLVQGDEEAASLKQKVSSKGGTTIAGLDVLEAPEAMPDLLGRAVAAAAMRARALSSGR